jgi:dihydrofolate synthase/folylpolyglutamate synthase
VNQTDSFGRYFAVLDSHGYLVSNLVTALQALNCWGLELQYDRVQHGLAELRLAGRQTYLQHAPALLVDVAHNPQAAAALAQRLRRDTPVEVSHARLAHAGVTHALFGILDDKDLAETVAPLLGVVDRWHVVDLSKYTARGASAKQLVALLQDSGALVEHVEQAIASACARILAGLSVQDRLVVWGSFYMAGPVLAAYEERLDGSRA